LWDGWRGKHRFWLRNLAYLVALVFLAAGTYTLLELCGCAP
jgi:succinate dehydrogenase hydrophobic anchor subunit